MTRPVLIFDFDGTVALGDGPLLAYALAAAGHAADPVAAEKVVAAVADEWESPSAGVIDGYDAVRRVALAHGIDDDLLASAYADSRALLSSPDAPLVPVDGLARVLADADADRILLTNAPATRLDDALADLGLTGLFDRVITDAAKPAGLDLLLDELDPAAPVLAIGDVWRNDLAPAHARGHQTALVGGYHDPSARPTFRAVSLHDLLPEIERWLAESRSRSH